MATPEGCFFEQTGDKTKLTEKINAIASMMGIFFRDRVTEIYQEPGLEKA